MTRIKRAVALAGIVAAASIMPAASASAATCVGISRDPHQGVGNHTGAWNCGDDCPDNGLYFADGVLHAFVCLDNA